MKKVTISLLLLSLFVSLVCSVKAEPDVALANKGSALKSDSIKDEPFHDAKIIGNLEKGESIEILTREGGWYQVKSAKAKGWVRMLGIRRADSPKPAYTAKGILDLASGRAGKGKVVLTTGIRGLDEETLKTSHFDEKQLNILESYGVSNFQARKFAAIGRLKARHIEYLQIGGGR